MSCDVFVMICDDKIDLSKMRWYFRPLCDVISGGCAMIKLRWYYPSPHHHLCWPWVNFINKLTRSFYARRSQKRKKLLDLTVFFALLGSAHVKAVSKETVKSDLFFFFFFLKLKMVCYLTHVTFSAAADLIAQSTGLADNVSYGNFDPQKMTILNLMIMWENRKIGILKKRSHYKGYKENTCVYETTWFICQD